MAEENGSSNILWQNRKRRSRDGAKSVDTESKKCSVTMNLDTLDCPVCFEALTIPVFQCDNGHLACSSCCPKLNNKCPVCALPIGHNRCRAMESVLESVLLPCPNAKFGCTKNLTYGKESTHEKECSFSPCSCSVLDCNYTGSYKDLSGHYSSKHFKEYISNVFYCGVSTKARMNSSDKILIIRDFMEGLLFVVQCFRELYGVYVTVSCIAPSAPEIGEFSYDISCSIDGRTIRYESPQVKKIQKVSFQIPQDNDFMFIHRNLLRGQLLDMKLSIKEK